MFIKKHAQQKLGATVLFSTPSTCVFLSQRITSIISRLNVNESGRFVCGIVILPPLRKERNSFSHPFSEKSTGEIFNLGRGKEIEILYCIYLRCSVIIIYSCTKKIHLQLISLKFHSSFFFKKKIIQFIIVHNMHSAAVISLWEERLLMFILHTNKSPSVVMLK